tara:strand:- start:82321 stop:82791 length:471 start_codon:yes stop_codon:yes gene_type:complete
MKEAIFGAGCFWEVEYKFSKLDGVEETNVGYAAGVSENPNYQTVCSGTTGHAEVVKVNYDESKISYLDLLKFFFQIHDPTQVNRQGPDVGSQYRSLIITSNSEQEKEALNYIEELNSSKIHSSKVATIVQGKSEYYPAEEYHQKYLEKKGVTSCKI